MRAIIDLESQGRIFRAGLVNLGIAGEYVTAAQARITELEYVYNESLSLIFMAHSPSEVEALRNLKNSPFSSTLTFVRSLNNPTNQGAFTELFYQFGMFIFFQLQRYFKNKPHASYLLESATEDYIIVYVDENLHT